MELIETLNRTMKLALDDGSAGSVEEAERMFGSFHVQVIVGSEVAANRALQAALLTLLNAAPRTFLGEVTVTGHVDFEFGIGWHTGLSLRDVATHYRTRCTSAASTKPSIFVGQLSGIKTGYPFALHLSCTDTGFLLSPDAAQATPPSASVGAGVAAAGAALNECFQHLYFRRPWAGLREVDFSLPGTTNGLAVRPRSIWVIGLGHLGQALLWTYGLDADGKTALPLLRLQDYDRVTRSSLSTGLLTQPDDVGRLKVDVAAEAMEVLGFACDPIPNSVDLERQQHSDAEICIVAVDSIGFRRKLDRMNGPRIVEAGIGDGIEGFTKAQLHVLPGRRAAADIWQGDDARATRRISIAAPAYQDLLRKTTDECGTTQLAGRSIATPFIGAFVGATMHSVAMGRPLEIDSVGLDVNTL